MIEKRNNGAKVAAGIAAVCVFTYFVSYYIRNLLSVSTPEMLTYGFNKEFIGTLSSTYMFVYAVGQLVNGALGDVVRPKFMALIGLCSAGGVSIAFAFVTAPFLQILLFAFLGFSLSMLRGPLVKTMCENMKSEYAHVACVFLSVITSAGPLAASLFSIAFDWKGTFAVAGATGVFFAAVAFVILTAFEKKEIISYKKLGRSKKEKRSVFALFKLHDFFYYMLVGMICEIAGTTITFWLPTYLTERLSFDESTAGILFSSITLINSLAPFAALMILKLFGGRDKRMSGTVFAISAVSFLGVFFIEARWINILLILLALASVRLSSTLLWSVYIPDQAESGLVSTLNGFLDFSGYVAATLANLLFSFTVAFVGWGGIVLMWCALALLGILAALLASGKRKKIT